MRTSYNPRAGHRTAVRVRDHRGKLRHAKWKANKATAEVMMQNHQQWHSAPFVGQTDPNCNACKDLQKQLEEATA